MSVDFSLDDFEWLETFRKDAGLNRSDVMRAALRCDRASAAPQVILTRADLERRLRNLETSAAVRRAEEE